MAGEVKDMLWRDNTWGCLAWLISLVVLFILVGLGVLPSTIFANPVSCEAIKDLPYQYDRNGNPIKCDF